jgi:hypothetical protein
MSAVAKLMAVVGMDATAYKAGMKDAENHTKTFQDRIQTIGKTIAGAFAFGQVIRFGQSLLDWGTKIKEAADSVGLLYSEMERLGDIADDSGTTIDQVAKLISRIEDDAFAAANGTRELSDGYKNIGIEVSDLFGGDMDPVKRLKLVADAALNAANPTAALAGVFGQRLGPQARAALGDIVEAYDGVNRANDGAIDSTEKLGTWFSNVANAIKRDWAEMANDVVAGWDAMLGGDMRQRDEVRVMQQLADRKAAELDMQRTVTDAAIKAILERQQKEDEAAAATLKRYSEEAHAFKRAEAEKTAAENAEKQKRLREQSDKELNSLINQANSIDAQSGADQRSARGTGIQVDAMAQMGGFRGTERPMLAATDKMLRQQEIATKAIVQIREINERIEAKIGNGGAAIGEG